MIGHALLVRLLPPLGYLIIRFLALTMRITIRNKGYVKKFWDQGQAVIVTFWHGRLLMMPLLKEPGRNHIILISHHRDGEYISRTMKLLGMSTARGSTTRGWIGGIKEMLRAYASGFDLVVTPDGPRGPKEVVQEGVVELARATGAPICPVTFGASRKIFLKSWDGFMIPLPFSRGIFLWGEPIVIPRDVTREELEGYRLLLQKRLKELTDLADSIFEEDRCS